MQEGRKAAGLEEASHIAKSSPVLRALGFGGVDLAADLRATFGFTMP